LSFSHSKGHIPFSHSDFNFCFWLAEDGRHLAMCFLDICVSVVKCLLRSSDLSPAYLFLGWGVFVVCSSFAISFSLSLSFFFSPYFVRRFANIFSSGLSFCFLHSVLWRAEVINFSFFFPASSSHPLSFFQY
jgi:hypothetical protein